MRRVWTIIPARGGSKGLPRKNIAPLGGRPLIAYSIAVAAPLSRVVVSTDDPEIARAACAWGAQVPFLRPPELATDTANLRDAVFYTVDRLVTQEGAAPDAILILCPTSPFRTAGMLREIVGMLEQAAQVSTVALEPFVPSAVVRLVDGRIAPLAPACVPVRALRPCGLAAAMIYAPPGKRFFEDRAAWMRYLTEERGMRFEGGRIDAAFYEVKNPYSLIDIDHPEDLARAEEVLRQGLFKFDVEFRCGCS